MGFLEKFSFLLLNMQLYYSTIRNRFHSQRNKCFMCSINGILFNVIFFMGAMNASVKMQLKWRNEGKEIAYGMVHKGPKCIVRIPFVVHLPIRKFPFYRRNAFQFCYFDSKILHMQYADSFASQWVCVWAQILFVLCFSSTISYILRSVPSHFIIFSSLLSIFFLSFGAGKCSKPLLPSHSNFRWIACHNLWLLQIRAIRVCRLLFRLHEYLAAISIFTRHHRSATVIYSVHFISVMRNGTSELE